MIALVPFELKKLLIKKSVLGAVLAIMLVLAGLFYANFFNDGQISGSSADRIHGKQAVVIKQKIAEEHTGYLSDELMDKIVNDYAANMPYFKQNDLYDMFSWYAIDRLVPNSQEILTDTYKSDDVLHYDQISLKSQEELQSHFPLKTLKLGNFAPWHKLFNTLNAAFSLMVVFVIYICCSVFSGDRARKMDSLLLTTKYGRNQLTIAKIVSVFGIATLTFVLVNSLVLLVFGTYFGWSGWDTSVQMNLEWISTIYNILRFPVHMNLLELLIRLILFQFVGLLFILGVMVLISSLTKSPLATFASSVGMFLAPDFLMNIFRDGLMNKILTIFSISTDGTEGILLKLSNSKGFFFNDFTANGVSVIMLRLSLMLLCCLMTYRIIRKRGL